MLLRAALVKASDQSNLEQTHDVPKQVRRRRTPDVNVYKERSSKAPGAFRTRQSEFCDPWELESRSAYGPVGLILIALVKRKSTALEATASILITYLCEPVAAVVRLELEPRTRSRLRSSSDTTRSCIHFT